MEEDKFVVFVLGLTALITYPFASALVRDFAKSFKKGSAIRKLLVVLSIIPVLNIILLFGMKLKEMFEIGRWLTKDLIKDFREEFRSEKDIVLRVQSLQKEFYNIVDYETENNPFGDDITYFPHHSIESAEVEVIDIGCSYEWTVCIDGDKYGGFIEKCAVENLDINMHRLSVLFLEAEIKRLRMEKEHITDESFNDYVETEISKIEGVLKELK